MNNFITRFAKKGDISSINELSREMHRHLGKMVGLKFSDEELEDENVNVSELKGIFVAEEVASRKIVGYVSFSSEPEEDEWYGKHIYLFEIAVREGFRGRGIGEGLINQVIGLCKSKNLNLKVDTLNKNLDTVRFYKKFGFKPFMTYFILENKKRLNL